MALLVHQGKGVARIGNNSAGAFEIDRLVNLAACSADTHDLGMDLQHFVEKAGATIVNVCVDESQGEFVL